MFISINIEQKQYKKDDIVVSIKEIRNGYGFFTVGHEFTVIEKVPKYSCYSYRLIDNEHEIIIKADSDWFTLKTPIEETRQIYIDITERHKALEFIKNICPNRDYEYDRYDKYDTCTLKKKYKSVCKCEISCVNYVNKSKIDESSFMKLYIRKLKIKKIIK
jgi:hypothetical protein